MSATDELRRMLDERGVEWWEDAFSGEHRTVFDGKDGVRYCVYQLGCVLFISSILPVTPEQAIAVTLGRPTWRNSYDQERYDRWCNLLHHNGKPTNFAELVEEIIWMCETVALGPNGNTCQGFDEGEVQTDGLINHWADIAATLGDAFTREDVEGAFVSGYSLGTLPVGSDPQWDENRQTVDEHMAELGWVRERTCELTFKRGAMYDVAHYSCCGYEYPEPISEVAPSENFCPNCGAKVVSE